MGNDRPDRRVDVIVGSLQFVEKKGMRYVGRANRPPENVEITT